MRTAHNTSAKPLMPGSRAHLTLYSSNSTFGTSAYSPDSTFGTNTVAMHTELNLIVLHLHIWTQWHCLELTVNVLQIPMLCIIRAKAPNIKNNHIHKCLNCLHDRWQELVHREAFFFLYSNCEHLLPLYNLNPQRNYAI